MFARRITERRPVLRSARPRSERVLPAPLEDLSLLVNPMTRESGSSSRQTARWGFGAGEVPRATLEDAAREPARLAPNPAHRAQLDRRDRFHPGIPPVDLRGAARRSHRAGRFRMDDRRRRLFLALALGL